MSVSPPESWLISYTAEYLEIEPDEVDVHISFERHGLDSAGSANPNSIYKPNLAWKLSVSLLKGF